MAIADWSTNADSNTSIDGISIAEHCSPANINDAIRAVMAACKTEQLAKNTAIETAQTAATAAQTTADAALPKTGGTMSGNITFSNENTRIYRNTTNGNMLIGGGSSYANGSYISLEGETSSSPGMFSIAAVANSVTKELRGYTDGTLKWNLKDVERVDSSGSGWIRYTSGLQIVWMNGTSQTHDTVYTFTFPKSFAVVPIVTTSTTNGVGTGTYMASTYSITTTSVQVTVGGSTGSFTPRIIAIGKWA